MSLPRIDLALVWFTLWTFGSVLFGGAIVFSFVNLSAAYFFGMSAILCIFLSAMGAYVRNRQKKRVASVSERIPNVESH